MRLNDVRSINCCNNITDAEDDIRSRKTSSWQLYVVHYFSNQRAERLTQIEDRRTSTIISMSSSSLSSDSTIDLCSSSDNESVPIPEPIPDQSVTLEIHPILNAAYS